MDTGLDITFPVLNLFYQNYDPLLVDFTPFTEAGLETLAENREQAELTFTRYCRLILPEVVGKSMVGQQILINPVGTLPRRSHDRQVTDLRLLGSTIILVLSSWNQNQTYQNPSVQAASNLSLL